MDEYKNLNEKEEKIRNEILQHLSTVVTRISEITEFDYEKILTDFILMFGISTSYKKMGGDNEWTVWSGRNIDLSVMRPRNTDIIGIRINCFPLDDSSPTDKLY